MGKLGDLDLLVPEHHVVEGKGRGVAAHLHELNERKLAGAGKWQDGFASPSRQPSGTVPSQVSSAADRSL